MYRNLQNSEIAALSAQGCTAEDWSRITVAEGFHTDWIRNVVFSGEVKLGSNGAEIACGAGVIRRSGVYNAALHNCTVGDGVLIYNVGRYIANYDIAEGVMIENVGQISCEGSGSFGNGVEVSAINEAGGREVPIYDELTAQVAYVMAMYRLFKGIYRKVCFGGEHRFAGRCAHRRLRDCGWCFHVEQRNHQQFGGIPFLHRFGGGGTRFHHRPFGPG